MKPTLFLTRTLPKPAIDKLNSFFTVTQNLEDRVLTKEEIIHNTKGKDALLCLLTDTIDKSVIEACPKLKVISNYAVGFNNIDIATATARKIPVCITPGILTETTADLTWALILAITRRVVEGDQFTRKGLFKGWGPMLMLGNDVYGKTLGIVGLGRIGEAVARRALGFGMKILYCCRTAKTAEKLAAKQIPSAQFVSLDQLLKESDVVTLHTPLTAETIHLINEKSFAMMKPTSYLINTTRGPVVDEKALLKALQTNQIAGAGLDVYENEPELLPGLADLDNIVVLPHVGSATIETRTNMGIMAAENAIAVFNGEMPRGIANPEVLS